MTFIYLIIIIVAIMIIPGWVMKLSDKYKDIKRQKRNLLDSKEMLIHSSYKISKELPSGVKIGIFKDNLIGLIDKDGNLINGVFYDSISEPRNGKLVVTYNGKSALIDESGNYIINFSKVDDVTSSITFIGESFYRYFIKKKSKHLLSKDEIHYYCYILNADGQFLFSSPFVSVSSFNEYGYALVEDEKYVSRINKEGKLDSNYKLPKGKHYQLFKDNIYLVGSGSLTSLWDCTKGMYIFEDCYAILFKDWNVFFCKYNKKEYGPIQPYAFVVDENMETIIPAKYNFIDIMVRRFYICRYYESNNINCPQHMDVYDRQGNLLFQNISSIRCPRYGNVFWVYKNNRIEVVDNDKIVDIYDYAKGFDYTSHIFSIISCDPCISEVYSAEPTKYIVSKGGKFGVVSDLNDIIQPFEYDNIEQFKRDYSTDQMYLVSQNGLYGLLNSKGNLILKPNYKEINYVIGNDVILEGNLVTLNVNTLNFSD